MKNTIRIILYFLCVGLIVSLLYVKEAGGDELELPQVQEPKTLDQLITFYALKYNVKESIMRKVINCESGYKENAVGDKGKSFGLVQIHLPSHPYVSKEQAFDPDFALDFLANKLSQKKGKIWTCYRKFYT